MEVWITTSEQIIRNISSRRYLLIEPDNQKNQFVENTPQNFEIVGESFYWESWKQHFDQKITARNFSRQGWYLQQLIKLSAAKHHSNVARILIWDADTVPLRKIQLFEPDESINYVVSEEFHKPYFNNIQLLLNLGKVVDYSFISQCFPVSGDLMESFSREIEVIHNQNWIQAIIDCINPTEESGFSEYESLGTFISNKYPELVKVSSYKWIRHGYWLTKNEKLSSNFVFKLLLINYHFISFETWDKNVVSFKQSLKFWIKLVLKSKSNY